MDWSHLG